MCSKIWLKWLIFSIDTAMCSWVTISTGNSNECDDVFMSPLLEAPGSCNLEGGVLDDCTAIPLSERASIFNSNYLIVVFNVSSANSTADNFNIVNKQEMMNYEYYEFITLSMGNRSFMLINVILSNVSMGSITPFFSSLYKQGMLIEHLIIDQMTLNSSDVQNALKFCEKSLITISIRKVYLDNHLDLTGIQFDKLSSLDFCKPLGGKLLLRQNFLIKVDPIVEDRPRSVLRVTNNGSINRNLNVIFNGSFSNQNLVWNGIMYPRFFQLLGSGNKMPSIFIEGPTFLTKDVLSYLNSAWVQLSLSRLERIEYGTISHGEEFFIDAIRLSEEYPFIHFGKNRNETVQARFFLDGDCTALNAICGVGFEACIICFMHQYGLHKTNDNVESLCGQTTTPVSLKMKKCYWGPFLEKPIEISNFEIEPMRKDNWLVDGPFCRPIDVPENYDPFTNPYGFRSIDSNQNSSESDNENWTSSSEITYEVKTAGVLNSLIKASNILTSCTISYLIFVSEV